MGKQDIRTKLMRIAALMIAGSILLVVIAAASMRYVIRAIHETTHEQMRQEAIEYRTRIQNQIQKDFETLASAAAFIEFCDPMNRENLLTALSHANRQNAFITMAFFFPNGAGIINTQAYAQSADFPLSNCTEILQDTVRQAMEGAPILSRLFKSQLDGMQIYAYAVPVYKAGNLVGVLIASNHLEMFEGILNTNTVMGGNGFIHLVNDEGKFLVYTDNPITENMPRESLFESGVLSDRESQKVRNALAGNSATFAEFRNEHKGYHFYVLPVNINNWFLVCVDTLWGSVSMGSASSFYRIFIITGGALAAILILTNILLFHGHALLRKSYGEILRLAYYDQVTGSENTQRFKDRLEETRRRKKEYSIVALNIRNFKLINELFGELEGNRLLYNIKDTIEKNLEEEEFFCRDTADLFYILLLDSDHKVVRERVRKLIRRITERTKNEEYSQEIHAYCGIAVNGEMMHALIAMQSLKGQFQKNVTFCDDNIYKRKIQESRIESRMQSALKNSEFKLFLQPKFSFSDGKISSAEALVRWQTDENTFMPPGEFIPLFERNGFCAKLDIYMVENVCRKIREWMNSGVTPVPISINQTKLLFHEKSYIHTLDMIVSNYHIPPELITLEILEGLADDDPDEINMKIHELKKKGFRVSMDDFGTGYSSLTILSRLEIDELKLDQAFLREASENRERNKIILEQIIQMTKRLGIDTVAEGVETKEDVEFLTSIGCDYGQGYFYSRPISAAEFDEKYIGIHAKGKPPASATDSQDNHNI